MSEIISFIMGAVLSWPLFIVILLLAVLADTSDRPEWEVFFLICHAIIGFFILDLSWSQALIVLALYVPLGVCWSGYRWYRFCNDVAEQYKASSIRRGIAQAEDKLSIERNIGQITFWICVWPYSMLASVCGDFIYCVQKLVKNKIRSVYEAIASKSLESIPRIDETSVKNLVSIIGEENIDTVVFLTVEETFQIRTKNSTNLIIDDMEINFIGLSLEGNTLQTDGNDALELFSLFQKLYPQLSCTQM